MKRSELVMLLNTMPDVDVGIWNDEAAEWIDIQQVRLGVKWSLPEGTLRPQKQIQISDWVTSGSE